MSIVQLFPDGNGGGGGGVPFEPNEPTTFTANTVPYINGSQEVVVDTNFTYQSSRLGVGTNSPSATGHFKGANDSAASYSLIVQSATNEIIKVENNRSILIGAGSKLANTTYTVNAIGAGAASTDITMAIVGGTSDNIFRFMNSTGFTRGGLEIVRDTVSSGRTAVGIYGGATNTLAIYSSGAIEFSTSSAWKDDSTCHIQHTTTASTYPGLILNVDSDNDDGLYIHKGRTLVNFGDNKPFVNIVASFTDSGGPTTGTLKVLSIYPTFNYTGAGTMTSIGIEYNPTMTSTDGEDYGILVRPLAVRNGFGLASTLPTARVHIAANAGVANYTQIKLGDGSLVATPEDGAIEHASDHLYFTTGTFRRPIDNDFDATPDTDHTANGFTTNTINAGATIAIMETCYLASDGEWALTDADAESTASGMLAISLESKTDGQAMRVITHGYVRDDSWAWTAGQLIYLSTTPGALTATAPSATGDVVRVVGYAITADVIYFNPSNEYSVIL